jgi:hypothetical protein
MKSTRFMTAEEKGKVLKDWQRFIGRGFSKTDFTKSLYDHLIQHCSFIAHYNRHGFYSSYFEDPEDTMRFLNQFDEDFGCKSVEYGMDYWLKDADYDDINAAMVNAFEPHKRAIYTELKQKAKEMKLKQMEKLKIEIDELDRRGD